MDKIELQERPNKKGYLEIQINSLLDIWSNKFFILDGTNLLIYDDETSEKPYDQIEIEGTSLIDGVWTYSSCFFTFMLR